METNWPEPPEGFVACRTTTGRNEQTTHLVKVNARGGHGGPTVCGLDRFPTADVPGPGTLPSWSISGGVWGDHVTQVACDDCYRTATQPEVAVAGD